MHYAGAIFHHKIRPSIPFGFSIPTAMIERKLFHGAFYPVSDLSSENLMFLLFSVVPRAFSKRANERL